MVICSSEGCDESGGVDSLVVVEVPGVQSAGSPLHKHDTTPRSSAYFSVKSLFVPANTIILYYY